MDIQFQQHRRLRRWSFYFDHKEFEIVHCLEANKLVRWRYKDVGRRPWNPGLEIKEAITHSSVSSISIMFASALASQVPQVQWEGTRNISLTMVMHHRGGTPSLGNPTLISDGLQANTLTVLNRKTNKQKTQKVLFWNSDILLKSKEQETLYDAMKQSHKLRLTLSPI